MNPEVYINEPEFYDSQYHLHPSRWGILNFDDEVNDLHSTDIELEWATKQINHSFLDWVNGALLADKVRLYR
jgi:hypothetical protein